MLSIAIYLFMTVLGLRCCSGVFSSCGEQGLPSSCGLQASHCSDFSCCKAQALGRAGFSSHSSWSQGCGSQALVERLRAAAPRLWCTGSGLRLSGSGAQAQGCGSQALVHRLRSCSSQALMHRLRAAVPRLWCTGSGLWLPGSGAQAQ